jgi:hypothetical protein|tara:strand:- start:34739 stop:34939 length:201 start_codon:yes stop_codon:yes gene_type:complete
MITSDSKLDLLKQRYAEMIVDSMDMDTLVNIAVDGITQNIKDWEEIDIKEEVIDLYGSMTWDQLNT